MGAGRSGGAKVVWPDSNINFLGKQLAHNGESSDIDVGSIVALRASNNGSALKAFLALGSNSSQYAGQLAVALGGFGTGDGQTLGTSVRWKIADLDTSSSAVDALVFVNGAAPGVATLTAAAKAMVVGKVIRVGTSATDTKNTILLFPGLFKSLGNPAEITDPGAAASFVSSGLLLGNGGTCTLEGLTGTRTLPDPTVQGQEVTFLQLDTTARNLDYPNGLDQGGNTSAPMAQAGDWIRLVALPVGAGGALRWRVVASEGITLAP